MMMVVILIAVAVGFLSANLSPLDWAILMDAARMWRETLENLIPLTLFMLGGGAISLVTRWAAFLQFKNHDVRLHMPEIIRIQMGDLEQSAKHNAAEARYWKARAEEQNAVVRNAGIVADKLRQVLDAIESEDQIQRRKRA